MASVPVLDLQSLAEMADDLAAHRAFPDRVEPCLVPQGPPRDLQALPEGVSPEIIGPVSERASSSRSATAPPRADTGSFDHAVCEARKGDPFGRKETVNGGRWRPAAT